MVTLLMLHAANAEGDATDTIIELKNSADDYNVWTEIKFSKEDGPHKYSFLTPRSLTARQIIPRESSQIILQVWLRPQNSKDSIKLYKFEYPTPVNVCQEFKGSSINPFWHNINCDSV